MSSKNVGVTFWVTARDAPDIQRISGATDIRGQIHYPLSVYPLSVLTKDSKTDSKRQKRKKCLFSHEKTQFFGTFFDHFSTIFSKKKLLRVIHPSRGQK